MEVKSVNSSTNVTSINSKSSARRRNPNISWGRSFVGKLREDIELEVRQEYEKRFQAFSPGNTKFGNNQLNLVYYKRNTKNSK